MRDTPSVGPTQALPYNHRNLYLSLLVGVSQNPFRNEILCYESCDASPYSLHRETR